MKFCNFCKTKPFSILTILGIVVLVANHASSAELAKKQFSCKDETDVTMVVGPDTKRVRFNVDDCVCQISQAELHKSLTKYCVAGFDEASKFPPEKAQFWRHNPTPFAFMREVELVSEINIDLPSSAGSISETLYCVTQAAASEYYITCGIQALNLD